MIRVCRDLGVPEPEFREQDEDFMVTFRRSSVNVLLEQPELLNWRQKQAIEYLKAHGSITTLQYVNLVRCHERTARKDLGELVQLNVVVKQGLGKLTRYVIHAGFRHFPGG
ncbi:MAG: DeoR family transcriptional regulator [Methanoregula sp.]